MQDEFKHGSEAVRAIQLRVGACIWDPVARVLHTNDGQEVKLSWRALKCWGALVDAKGEMITREAIQELLWGDAQVDGTSLSQVIVSIRKAIDPAPNGKSHIETIPRIGFRLAVPPVEVKAGGQVSTVTVATSTNGAVPAEPPVSGGRRWLGWGLATALALAAGTVFSLRLASRSPDEEEAMKLLRSALSAVRRGSVDQLKIGRGLLDRAAALRPNLPLAKAVTAELAVRAGDGSFEQALTLAREAVAEDAACGDCQATLGFVLFTRFWNWDEARTHLDAATRQPDAPAIAHVWHAQLLGVLRQFPAAQREVDTAIRKDAGLPNAASMKGTLLYLDGRFGEALRQLDAAQSLDPANPNPPYWQSRAAWQLGMYADAAKYHVHHVNRFAGFSEDRSDQDRVAVIQVFQKGGQAALIARWLHETGSTQDTKRKNRYNRAVWQMWSGQPQQALDELEAAEEARPFNLIYVAADPTFAPLRSEPRFLALLRRLKLP